MAIRFLHLFDPDTDPRRTAEVQRIFRSYYGTVYAHSARKPHIARWSGRYHDQFRVIDGRWRIVERLQLTDYPGGYRPYDSVRP